VFISRYFIGTNIFPDVLLNDIAGPEGDPLLLSLKLSVDVLVSNSKLGSPDLYALPSLFLEHGALQFCWIFCSGYTGQNFAYPLS
jgi:hypothetical protein